MNIPHVGRIYPSKLENRTHSASLACLDIDKRGIFAYPQESIEDFIKDGESYPRGSSSLPPEISVPLAENFGIDEAFFAVKDTSEHLLPWEIACCMIEADGYPVIYIRPKGWLFHFVPKEVVITHELIHAFRGRLLSTVFEEYAAFDGAKCCFPNQLSSFRNWTGPLFAKPSEAILLCVILFAIGTLPFFSERFAYLPTLFALIGAVFCWPFARCTYRWHLWNKVKRILFEQFPAKMWAILIRLSDEEIYEIARLSPEQASSYFQQKQQESWRWAMMLNRLQGGQERL